MHTVSFTKAIDLHSGRIGLSEKQAALRSPNLKRIEDGLYEITGTVQFKAGEKIGLDEVPKCFINLLSPESAKAIFQAEARAREEALTADLESRLGAIRCPYIFEPRGLRCFLARGHSGPHDFTDPAAQKPARKK